ncbi:polysaccharide lyase [Actinomycetospora aeridis]|uniref:Polysaccharide lyase n=1 Tax=Actinomycetospora aeridis TaxID=3129231 RepID=A0ABU8N6S2_9PSEU
METNGRAASRRVSGKASRRAVVGAVLGAGLALGGGMAAPAAEARPGPTGPGGLTEASPASLSTEDPPTDPSADPSPTPPVTASVQVGARELFVGDFETGDFSQWNTCQAKGFNGRCRNIGAGNDQMRIVSGADARQGRHAARFNIRPGDVPPFGGRERSEVQSNAEGAVVHEGDERWYQWSMKFPENFENPSGGWFIVLQWHSSSGSPPLAINVDNDGRIRIGGDGLKSEPKRWLGSVRRGEWVDYTLHVKFSRDRGTGFVEGWENGQQTVPRYNRASMKDDENYLKQGVYRDEGPETWVMQDGMRITGP